MFCDYIKHFSCFCSVTYKISIWFLSFISVISFTTFFLNLFDSHNFQINSRWEIIWSSKVCQRNRRSLLLCMKLCWSRRCPTKGCCFEEMHRTSSRGRRCSKEPSMRVRAKTTTFIWDFQRHCFFFHSCLWLNETSDKVVFLMVLNFPTQAIQGWCVFCLITLSLSLVCSWKPAEPAVYTDRRPKPK